MGKSSPILLVVLAGRRADQRSVIRHFSTIVVKWRITPTPIPPAPYGAVFDANDNDGIAHIPVNEASAQIADPQA
jgi:hypothetical protein